MRTKPSKALRGVLPAAAVVLVAAGACGRNPRPSSTSPRADSVEVGYGAQARDKGTGAVTALDARDVNRRPLNVEEFLRGKVPGLQIVRGPNGPSFRLRASGATASAQEPEEALIVVDGVPIPSNQVNTALSGLTADDIKQVSVLRDVASTSVYGTRGSGGVILIVTKKE
jgi:TonB-dependent SusC/RagA subfamily outer membrane receptor